MTRLELEEKIVSLIGECEVERLKDGKYIVMFMSFSAPPPPTGTTEEEAMTNFITWFEDSSPLLDPKLPDMEAGDGAIN